MVSTTRPPLKTSRVGIERMPYCWGTRWCSSTSILATFTLPLYCLASSSTAGATALQGPHHTAQKSTRTGMSLFRTSWSKVPSARVTTSFEAMSSPCSAGGKFPWRELLSARSDPGKGLGGRGISPDAMSGLLFVSQAMLDSWAEQGKIDFVGNVMTLLAGEGQGRSYALEPAVRFMKLLGEGTDPHALVHKVKSVVQLREMGAEPVDDSCILGDVAYEVQPGFLAEAAALQAAATARPAPRPGPDAQPAGAAGAPAA